MKSKTVARISITVVMIIFGLTFLAIKVALRDIPPWTLAFIRFLVATMALLPSLWWKKQKPNLQNLPWGKLALMGLFGVTLFFVFENVGLLYTSASVASLILSSIPAATAILARVFLKESVSPIRAAGIGTSIFGVTLIVSTDWSPSTLSANTMLGSMLILASAVSWSAYTVVGRSLTESVSDLTATSVSTLFGTLFLTPFALQEYASWEAAKLSLPSIVSILYLGLVASAFAYVLYIFALGELEASEATVYVNISPLVAIVSGAVFLGETLLPLQAVGGLLALLGVYLASLSQNQEKRGRSPELSQTHVESPSGSEATNTRIDHITPKICKCEYV